MIIIDLTNKRFGQLTVKKRNGSSYGCAAWECECDCGNLITVGGQRLRENRVKDCGCDKSYRRYIHHSWEGHGDLSRTFYNHIITNAKKRKLEFNLTIEFLWELFLKQNKKCKISNVELYLGKDQYDETHGGRTASLDRIDSSKGYIQDNVQWVHKDINMMKYKLTNKQLLEWCKIIYNFNKEKYDRN